MTNGTAIDIKNSEDTNVNNNTFIDNNVIPGDIISVGNSTGTDIGDNVFKGNNVTDGDIIDIKDSEDTSVNNNTITGNDVDPGDIINVNNSTGTDINDNTIDDNKVNGDVVDIKNSTDTNVGNNTFTGNDVTGDVINVGNSTGTDIGDNVFKGNNVTDGDIIDIKDSEDTSVNNNTITGNDVDPGDIINVEGSTGTDINDNTTDNNKVNGTGIDIKDSEDTTVGNNTITNNDVTGDVINVGNSTGTEIKDNTFDGNNITDGNLIDVEGSKDTTIKDNTIKNNTLPTDGEIIKVENSTGSDISNNTYVDNVPSIDVDDVVIDEDLVINLPKDATGNVTVNIGGKTITVPVVNGTAVVPQDLLPAGNYTATLTYSGDDKYEPVTKSFNITIEKGIVVKAPYVTKYYHGPERFVVTVSDDSGVPIAGKEVTITINGVSYKRTTDDSGATSLPLNLNSGVYSVTVVVDNITVKAVVTILPTVNGTDVVKVFRNDTQYYATFRDSTGKYLAQGTTVRFNINGVMYTHVVDANGLAKLNINLPQGSYIITAYNPVTGEACANNITVIPLIVENNDLVKYYRNASQFVVKVIDSTGKAAPGLTVTYNVNGVFYYRTTDADGYARLNINLPPGDYVITSEYGGCRVANNIKVLPVLTASDMVKKQGSPDQFVATLVDGQGRPYANQVVSFNINGVLYNRLTDSDGKAKLNINLPAGEYIITSSFNGSNIANKITITP